MKRIFSIDITRGIIMIIMALDHVRDLMHVNALSQNPTNMATTTPVLFFTRWITHLCAPTFVFLAGTSVYLSLKNNNDIAKTRKFLLSRGLWLLLVEFTFVNFGMFFDIRFQFLIFEVIAAIGTSFIILSLLLKFSYKTIGIIGLIIIFSHDLWPLIPFAEGSMAKTILTPFFVRTALPLFAKHITFVGYPPIPWLGIMMVGFATGKLFELPEAVRKKIFFKIGAGALLLFVLLRFINIYGDPVLWSAQKTPIYTFLSFMNVSKYPPSLLFSLATLGFTFLILGAVEQVKNKITDTAIIYGRVPLFYFVLHFYFIHILLLIVLLLQGFHWANLDFSLTNFGRPKGVESGVPLWAVYLIWMGVVTVFYWPCKWFGQYKAKHKYWWLSYL